MRLKPLQRALYRSFKSIIIRLASLLDIHSSYHCVRAPIVISPLLNYGRDLASIRLKLVLVVLLTVCALRRCNAGGYFRLKCAS